MYNNEVYSANIVRTTDRRLPAGEFFSFAKRVRNCADVFSSYFALSPRLLFHFIVVANEINFSRRLLVFFLSFFFLFNEKLERLVQRFGGERKNNNKLREKTRPKREEEKAKLYKTS